MSFGITPTARDLTVVDPAVAAAVPPPAAAAPAPPVPSPAQRDEDDLRVGAHVTAYGRALELSKDDRELHFSKDDHGRIVVVEVRSLTGEVVRTIPDDEAKAILSGKRKA